MDGSDRYRLTEAKEEIFNFFGHEKNKNDEHIIMDKPIIIVANKQDLVEIKSNNHQDQSNDQNEEDKWDQDENEVVKWEEIKSDYLEIHKLPNYSDDRIAFISTSALYGTGIWEILKWIINHNYAK